MSLSDNHAKGTVKPQDKPIATPPVAQYRRFFSATLGAKTPMFLYPGYRRSRNTAAFLRPGRQYIEALL
jgi:hypothetical protein